MSLSRTIAEFLCRLDERTIPPEVMEKARACLLNGYGIALGCHATPYAPVARQVALARIASRASFGSSTGRMRPARMSKASSP